MARGREAGSNYDESGRTFLPSSFSVWTLSSVRSTESLLLNELTLKTRRLKENSIAEGTSPKNAKQSKENLAKHDHAGHGKGKIEYKLMEEKKSQ